MKTREIITLLLVICVGAASHVAHAASYAIQNTLNKPVNVRVWTVKPTWYENKLVMVRTMEPLKEILPAAGENGSTWTFNTENSIDLIDWFYTDDPKTGKATKSKEMYCGSEYINQNWNWQIVPDGVQTWKDWTPDGHEKFKVLGIEFCRKQ